MHRLVPSDNHALTPAEALSKFDSPKVVAAAFAWDDTYIEIHNIPNSNIREARELLRAKSQENANGVAPKVLWLLADTTLDGFREVAAGDTIRASSTEAIPESNHRYLAEIKKKTTGSTLPRRSAKRYLDARTEIHAASTESANWEPNKKNYSAAFSSGRWNTTTTLTWDDYTKRNSPQNIASSWGLESTLMVRNDGINGNRPNCWGGDRSEDFPGAFDGDYVTSNDRPQIVEFTFLEPQVWGDLEPYLDWWSAIDQCWQKNYDFGIGKPQYFKPNLDFGWGVRVKLSTRAGTQPAGPSDAYVQLVHDECVGVEASTFCMNLSAGNGVTYPGGITTIPTYGRQRGYWLPGTVNISGYSSSSPSISYITGSPQAKRFGDYTGDGIADVIYTRGAQGVTTVYVGSATGSLTGIGTRNWPFVNANADPSIAREISKIPDLNGDSYSDLVYINKASGQLGFELAGPKGALSYFPTGARARQEIGGGWGNMVNVLPGLTGSTRDIDAVNSSTGVLSRYTITSTDGSGGSHVVGVGSTTTFGGGWNAMTGMARLDWNRDGTWDILAKRSDGALLLYTVSSSGSVSYTKQIGSGWSDYEIQNVGDLTGDGHNDVFAIDGAGGAFVYPTTGSGFGSRRQVGSGFSTSSDSFVS